MRVILFMTFWTRFECCVDFFKPLWVMQRKADTDGPSYVSFCYPDMLECQVYIDNFKGPIPHRQQTEACTIFSLRWEKLHQPLLSAGYVLHPAYIKRDWFNDAEITTNFKQVFGQLCSTGAEAATPLLDLNKYHTKQGSFSEGDMWSKAAWRDGALAWWEIWGGNCPALQEVALRVLSTVVVTSGAEPNWSIFGFIHSKRRNRLYDGRVEKLVYVYQNMRLLRKRQSAGSKDPVVAPHLTDDEDSDAD